MSLIYSIASTNVRDSFRARVGDVVSPYRIKDALILSMLNDAIQAIAAVNQDAVNDDAILASSLAALTSLAVTGTATGGTTGTLVDTGKSWTPDAWINHQVLTTGGTNAGQRRTITDNDATSLTVATWLAPSTDTTYAICDIPLKPQLVEALVFYMLAQTATRDAQGAENPQVRDGLLAKAKYFDAEFLKALRTWGRA